MNKEEIIKNLSKKNLLTLEEAKLLLDTICNLIKEKFKIKDNSCRQCISSYYEIMKLCLKNNIEFSGLNNEYIGLDAIPHYYNFIGLETTAGGIWFLIDPTYIQFDCDEYIVDIDFENKIYVSPGTYFPKEYKEELLKYGYITYTKEHLYSYINSFVISINKRDKTNIKVEDVIKKASKNTEFMFFSNIETIQDNNQKTSKRV